VWIPGQARNDRQKIKNPLNTFYRQRTSFAASPKERRHFLISRPGFFCGMCRQQNVFNLIIAVPPDNLPYRKAFFGPADINKVVFKHIKGYLPDPRRKQHIHFIF